MTSHQREKYFIYFLFSLCGLAIDFLFNGVVIFALFHRRFSESWAFIYIPLDICVGLSLLNYLYFKYGRSLLKGSALAYFGGILFVHLVFVGATDRKVYEMTLVPQNKYIILHSDQWPQILFVGGDKVERSLGGKSNSEKVPVVISFVKDYGCIRAAEIYSVGNLDLHDDHNFIWTWRTNHYSKASDDGGPGTEDANLPWCNHQQIAKVIGEAPAGNRPWDEAMQ